MVEMLILDVLPKTQLWQSLIWRMTSHKKYNNKSSMTEKKQKQMKIARNYISFSFSLKLSLHGNKVRDVIFSIKNSAFIILASICFHLD